MELWLFWLILGFALCLAELFVPTAFFELAMGLSALVVALLAQIMPNFLLQAGLWLLLSILFVFLTRRFVRQRQPIGFKDDKNAKTLTPILPGQMGRVLYEGNSWQARCADPQIEMLPNQNVIVVRREGTTLIIAPL